MDKKKAEMIDISNLSKDGLLKILYNNAKWNRKVCNEHGDKEGELFWSGTLNGLYATLDNLEISYEWLDGRYKDFNEYNEIRIKI